MLFAMQSIPTSVPPHWAFGHVPRGCDLQIASYKMMSCSQEKRPDHFRHQLGEFTAATDRVTRLLHL
jgi:hypothetical protein